MLPPILRLALLATLSVRFSCSDFALLTPLPQEEYANIEDLQSFYKEQRPDAVGTSFKFVSVNGGQNPQNLSLSGAEAALDVQFAYGLAYPIPVSNFTYQKFRVPYHRTLGSVLVHRWETSFQPEQVNAREHQRVRAPIDFRDGTSTDITARPYADWLDHVLSQKDAEIPKSISTSYGDDEQTGEYLYSNDHMSSFTNMILTIIISLSSSQLRHPHMQPIRPTRRSWCFGHLLLW